MWTEEDTKQFIAYGKAFTPMRDTQYRIVTELVSQSGSRGTIHELCSGAGELAKAVLAAHADIRLKAWDGSPTMLAHTRTTCQDYADRLDTGQFDLADKSWRRKLEGAAAVYSSLAIHHLDGNEKKQLFADVHDMMGEGGCFVIADLMMPLNSTGLEISAWQWDQEVQKNSLTQFGDDRAYRAFQESAWNFFLDPGSDPVDRPSSVQEHLNWLEEAGFVDVDLHWMVAGHAIVSGRKK